VDPKDIARFWKKVTVLETHECWLWTGVPDKNGYGEFHLQGKTQRAHRVAFLIANGSWPDPEGIHTCDERYSAGDLGYRLCVNPAHIKAGSHAENMQRAALTNRQLRGEARRQLSIASVPRGEEHYWRKNPDKIPRGSARAHTKLTDDNVREVFLNPEGLTGNALAKKFGVCAAVISEIRSGKRWAHVTSTLRKA
jgi:hypothetical protein